jgi:hypothetical protein
MYFGKLKLFQSWGCIPETHMLFVGEEFYCFGACDVKRDIIIIWKTGTMRKLW